MPMEMPEEVLAALIGAFGGLLLGLAARLGRFCTLGAIEDVLHGGCDLRLRGWMLAIGLAAAGTAGLELAGLFVPARSFYLAIAWNPWASVLGGLVFGYGMALSGMCGYGALARLGGGDLRAFVVVVVMGLAALMTASGPLAGLRQWLFPEAVATEPASVPAVLAAATGLPSAWLALGIGLAIAAAALARARMWQRPGRLLWPAAVAFAVVSAWAGTTWIAETGFSAQPVLGHSYAVPLGETLVYAMLASGLTVSFALGSVLGVVAGAMLGSLLRGQFRWEGCEDPRELRRQIGGAALMGAGAVVALGCTVGQGLTAFSLLALSAPVTLAAIAAGAALGLHQLIVGFAPSR